MSWRILLATLVFLGGMPNAFGLDYVGEIEGKTSGAYCGNWSPIFHDLDQDGNMDMLLGCAGGEAPQTPLSQPSEVLIIYGDGSLSTILVDTDDPSIVRITDTENTTLGWPMNIGDVNNDGRPDLLLSATEQNNGGNGKVYIFHGSAQRFVSMPVSSANAVYHGVNTTYWGISVVVGDLDNDGSNDMIISSLGVVCMYQGPNLNGGDSDNCTKRETGTAGFGARIELTHLDNDGVLDALISQAGLAKLHLSYGPLLTASLYDAELVGVSGSKFGYSHDTGDLNGDGHVDVAVGAQNLNSGLGYAQGGVYAFFGSASRHSGTISHENANVKITETEHPAELGRRVRIWDVDSNGKDDLLAGARQKGSSGEGAVYVFEGPMSDVVTDTTFANITLTGRTGKNDYFGDGFAMTSLDDENLLCVGAYFASLSDPVNVAHGSVHCWEVDKDSDDDGIDDEDDDCPLKYNPSQVDDDSDGFGNVCDPCPFDTLNECEIEGTVSEEIEIEAGEAVDEEITSPDQEVTLRIVGYPNMPTAVTMTLMNRTDSYAESELEEVSVRRETEGHVGQYDISSVVKGTIAGEELAELHFSINMTLRAGSPTGINSGHVRILHFDETLQEWEELDTTFVRVREVYPGDWAFEFTASITSFSDFAIAQASDNDGDGVPNFHNGKKDACPDWLPDTDLDGNPDDEPTHGLGFFRKHKLDMTTWNFVTIQQGQLVDSQWDIHDARGCTCQQILECAPGPNFWQVRKGCTRRVMKRWIEKNHKGWAKRCQTGCVAGDCSLGIMEYYGDQPAYDEDTDQDGIPDVDDTDDDNDGIDDEDDDEPTSNEADDHEDSEDHGTGCPKWYDRLFGCDAD